MIENLKTRIFLQLLVRDVRTKNQGQSLWLKEIKEGWYLDPEVVAPPRHGKTFLCSCSGSSIPMEGCSWKQTVPSKCIFLQ